MEPVTGATTTNAAPTTPNAPGASAGLTDDQLIDQAIAEHGRKATAEAAPDDTEEGEEAQTQGEEPAESTEPEESEEKEEEPKREAKADEEEEKAPELEDKLKEAELPKRWRQVWDQIKSLDGRVANMIRDEHYELKSYREQMPLADARQMRELFQNAEDANDARLARADLVALEQSLRESPDRFLAALQKGNPESFPKLVNALPAWVSDADPELYETSISRPAVQRMLDWAAKFGPSRGVELAPEAVAVLRELLEGWEKDTEPGPEEPYKRRLEEIEARDRALTDREVGGFIQSVRSECINQIQAEVDKIVDRYPGVKLTREAREDVRVRVLQRIEAEIMRDPLLRGWVNDSARNGPRTREHFNQVVSGILAKAKPMFGTRTREAINYLSKLGIRTAPSSPSVSERQVEGQPQARTETVSGAPPGSMAKQLKWSEMSEKEKRSMSDEEIFDAAVRGRLR